MLSDILTKSRHLLPADAHAEVRVQKNRNCRVTLLGGNLTANAKAETSGVSARVYKNGVYGFSSMAEYTPEAARAVLTAAEIGGIEPVRIESSEVECKRHSEYKSKSENFLKVSHGFSSLYFWHVPLLQV